MIAANVTNINTPLRQIKGKVELVNSSTTFTHTDNLQKFVINRVGENGKFFGFGVFQELTFDLVDKDREINLEINSMVKPYLTATEEYIDTFPSFEIDSIKRDENTNALNIVAYDILKRADKHTADELAIGYSSPQGYAEAAAALIGATGVKTIGISDSETCYIQPYPEVNLEGTETIREVLNAIAEVTQTIYYVDADDYLVFKRIKTTSADLCISKSDYFTLTCNEEPITLGAIASVTELGDNYIFNSEEFEGVTQYIRNNPFYELYNAVEGLLYDAVKAIEGLNIWEFECDWRGNYLLEIGDGIEIIKKDNGSIFSSLINDTLTYDGAFNQKTSWRYEETEGVQATPTSLGEVIKETYAKVDKVNKQIEMVASEAAANSQEISSLILNTDSISASVIDIEKQLNTNKDAISTLTQRVDAQITEENITIKVQEELANGVDKVITGKGFTFDDSGFNIEDLNPDTNNVIKTNISNNGMTVSANNKEKLKANDEGVKAEDLHATTYLIVGGNSRFEDYGSGRTGCFWIGGAN